MTIQETERLRLRKMSMSDTDNLLMIFSDPEAMQFYPGTKDLAETQRWIQWNQDSYEKHGHGLWIVESKETGEFVGQCGLVSQTMDDNTEVEIGYLFRRVCWGQGLATEAACACRDYGFDTLKLSRLISLIAPENHASRRVAEKVGMRLEQQIVKWNKDICLYAIEAIVREEDDPYDLSKLPVNPRDIYQARAQEMGVPFVDLFVYRPEQKAIDLIPERSQNATPLSRSSRMVTHCISLWRIPITLLPPMNFDL